MSEFNINYTDPVTLERKERDCEFHDTPAEENYKAITAYEWAYDLAYTLSGKRCDFKITEVVK